MSESEHGPICQACPHGADFHPEVEDGRRRCLHINCDCPEFLELPYPSPSLPEEVDHPSHYGGGDNPYEVIVVLEHWDHLGFHLGNVVKYVARAGKKDDILTDLKKARWYLDRKIRRLEETK